LFVPGKRSVVECLLVGDDTRRGRLVAALAVASGLVAGCGRSRLTLDGAGAGGANENGGQPERASPVLRYVAIGTAHGLSVVTFDELLAPVTLPMTTRGFNTGPPAWSRDGKQLAFSEFTMAGYWRIYVANASAWNDASMLVDMRPASPSAPWLYWLGSERLLVVFPDSSSPRPTQSVTLWPDSSVYLVELDNQVPVDWGSFHHVDVSPTGAGAIALGAADVLFLAANGTTERLDAGGADVRLSDDATELLVVRGDAVPDVTSTTLGVTSLWLDPVAGPREMTRAAYRDGYWAFEDHVTDPASWASSLHHLAVGGAGNRETWDGVALGPEPADWTWELLTAGDWVVARNFCATDVACSWRLDLTRDAGLTRKTAIGLAQSARLSGDEELLYVAANFESTSYLYASELGLRPPADRPVSITTTDAAIRDLDARPGGRELLVARVPWDAVPCVGGAMCGNAEYALVLDPLAPTIAELPGFAGPQWTPDGLGIVAERAETLVYAPILQPDAVYELGAARASEIYVPSSWPPAERPR
jgi:hypothetical protein